MKKIISLVAILMMAVAFVTAGSITDMQYKDKNLVWDTTRTVNDYDVDVDADTLGGYNYSSMISYIDSNDAVGSGISYHTVNNLLYGSGEWTDKYDNYYQLILDKFATKKELEDLKAKIAILEQAVFGKTISQEAVNMQVALTKAKESGKEVQTGKWYCTGKVCYTLE
jgi:hypothetical protein